VSLTDRLHFTVPGGLAAGEDLLVGVTFTLAGSLSPDALFDPIYGRFLDYDLNFYDWASSFDPEHQLATFGKLTATPFAGPLVLSKVVKIRGDFLLATVSMTLSVPGISQGSVEFLDLMDGATIALDLPPGVTFTSESGTFLSAPEPDAALMAATVLALGAIGGRRRR
jgi:MYXO-CTERM domain-containing protein